MTNTPNPFDAQALLRASLIGVGLSIFGVVMFIILWLALAGLENAPRLFTALCIPPLLIAVLVIVYRLTRGRST